MSAINDVLLDNLCESLKEGVDLETACYVVGLSPHILHSTMEKGRIEQFHRQSGNAPRSRQEQALKVWVRIMRARAEAVAFHVKVIKNAGLEGEWKASQFWLQRNHPGVYGANSAGMLASSAEDLPAIEGGF